MLSFNWLRTQMPFGFWQTLNGESILALFWPTHIDFEIKFKILLITFESPRWHCTFLYFWTYNPILCTRITQFFWPIALIVSVQEESLPTHNQVIWVCTTYFCRLAFVALQFLLPLLVFFILFCLYCYIAFYCWVSVSVSEVVFLLGSFMLCTIIHFYYMKQYGTAFSKKWYIKCSNLLLLSTEINGCDCY